MAAPIGRPVIPSLSQAEVDQFAGRWVAQSGGHVVASGLTRADLLAEMKRLDVHGAIWRIPVDREEAEATVLA